MPYIVKLQKMPNQGNWRAGYFPRKFHYKKDAEELQKEVIRWNGYATIEKVKGKN